MLALPLSPDLELNLHGNGGVSVAAVAAAARRGECVAGTTPTPEVFFGGFQIQGLEGSGCRVHGLRVDGPRLRVWVQ